MTSGRLNHGKIAKFGQILELHKSYLDITLKKGSKWPGDYKWQMTTTKFGMWTTNTPRIHPITSNSSKLSTSMTYLKFFNFAFWGLNIKIFKNEKNFLDLLSISPYVFSNHKKYFCKIFTLLGLTAIFVYGVKNQRYWQIGRFP